MRKIHYTLYREESDYIAQCLDFDISSVGETKHLGDCFIAAQEMAKAPRNRPVSPLPKER